MLAEDLIDSSMDIPNKTIHTWTGLFQVWIWTLRDPRKNTERYIYRSKAWDLNLIQVKFPGCLRIKAWKHADDVDINLHFWISVTVAGNAL